MPSRAPGRDSAPVAAEDTTTPGPPEPAGGLPGGAAARLLRIPRVGRYVAVGAVNTTASTVLFLVLHGAGVDVSIAGAIGFLAGALTSYVLNRGWTFADGERRHTATAWRFGVVTLVGLSLTALLLRIAVHGFGVPPLAGQLATVVLVTGVTYVLSRRWAFAPGARAPRVPPELAALLAGAAALNLWALSRNGWANGFYAAAARSMADNWHDFAWASFDPSGVMTVDKPPLSLWIQTISARTFGFHPLSLLVPQALMGVVTVGLVYDLTRRRFGRTAGAVAGAALALTPITVAMSRHNNPDALLILLSVLALWCVVRGLEHGGWGGILGAGLCVGLGFETKLAAALLVVPGLALAWLWVAPRGRWRALGQLAAAGGVLAAVGGAWLVAVALTPPESRPWIGGTTDNSAASLAFGYNGVARLAGQAGGPQPPPGTTAAANAHRVAAVFGGAPSPTRLFNPILGPQIGWLLPFALVGGLLVLVCSRLRRSDERTGWLIAVGGSFAVIAVAFSAAAGIFHPYYVSLLAPFAAALVGAGTGTMLHRRPVTVAFAVLAVGLTAGVQVVLMRRPDVLLSSAWPAVVAACAVAVLVLLIAPGRRWTGAALGAALAALLVVPGAWAVSTVGHPLAAVFPLGGPHVAIPLAIAPLPQPAAPPSGRPDRHALTPTQGLTMAVRYAARHGGGAVASMSQERAAPFVIRRDDVVGLGGFSGRESVVSMPWLAQRVAAGRVRWILLDSLRQQPKLSRVVRIACSDVRLVHRTPHQVLRLYDCAGRSADILAVSRGAGAAALASVGASPHHHAAIVNQIHTMSQPRFTARGAR